MWVHRENGGTGRRAGLRIRWATPVGVRIPLLARRTGVISMKVDVTTDGFKRQLSILVPREQVATRLEQEYKRLAGQVRMQGFRPGKTPRHVLQARFGPRVEADVK